VHVNRGVEGTAHERLRDLYPSPHSIRAVKSRRIRMQHVAFMVEKKKFTGFHWAKLKDRDHL
jgi:hypothetical protein